MGSRDVATSPAFHDRNNSRLKGSCTSRGAGDTRHAARRSPQPPVPPGIMWEKSETPEENTSAVGSRGNSAEEGPVAASPRFWRSRYDPEEFASVRRPSERVILNLSGTTFMTTRDTLARNPHTYFAAMLRMQPPSAARRGSTGAINGVRAGYKDKGSSGDHADGGRGDDTVSGGGTEFFIDRDPTHFRFILNYLRDSYIGLDSFGEKDMHFLEELSHEAQFFNISGLCADISRRMSEIARKHREGPSGDKDFRLVQCTTNQIQDVFHEWVIEKNYEFECMQIVADTAFIVLGRRVSRGELALVERLMKT